MNFSLSTCWNTATSENGADIAAKAADLGFNSLEVSYGTTPQQLPGFRQMLSRIPVTSVHAYCPVPPGAPSGHPELYQLCAPDEDTRALARLYLKQSAECADSLGARVVVFHSAYVESRSWAKILFSRENRIAVPTAAERKRRTKRGALLIDRFLACFEPLAETFNRYHLTLALENLPRFEGFPDTAEAEAIMKKANGLPIGLWFDTGHARIRECRTWDVPLLEAIKRLAPWLKGIHINDVIDNHDDHFAPGGGKVDFAALKPFVTDPDFLRVFETHPNVPEANLTQGLARLRALW